MRQKIAWSGVVCVGLLTAVVQIVFAAESEFFQDPARIEAESYHTAQDFDRQNVFNSQKETEARFAPDVLVYGDNVFQSAEKLSIDPATGTAMADIPIVVPPGRAGIQPAIALSYNSASPHGIAGAGWNLEFGKISRSTKFGIPTYTPVDTFILMQSGSRQTLVDVSGNATLFRPEIEGAFMKIEYVSGAFWRATDRKGVRYYFGQTSASQISDPLSSAHVFEWYLDRVEDIYGNYMTLEYVQDQNQIYPQKITYTGNTSGQPLEPYADITFVLQDREDAQISFRSGFAIRTCKRIKEILVSINNVLQRQYVLDYMQSQATKRSLLAKVTLIGDDGISSLPPTIFQYQNHEGLTEPFFKNIGLDPAAVGNHQWTHRVGGGYDHGHENYGPAPPPHMYFGVDWGPKQLVGDSTGQFSLYGIKDVAYWHWTYLYVPEDITLTVPYIDDEGSPGIWINGDIDPQHAVGHTWNLKAGFNRIDITNYHQHDSFGFHLNFNLANHVTYMHAERSSPQFSADFNADGLEDIAYFDKETGTVKVARSLGDAFAQNEEWIANFGVNKKIFLGHFNDDAFIDVVSFNKDNGTWRVALSDGTKFIDNGVWKDNFGSGDDQATGDFNGDGFTDIVTFYKSSGEYRAKIALNNKNGGFEEWTVLHPTVCPEGHTPFAADFNGDGLVDFGSYKRDSGHWIVRLNTGKLDNEFLIVFNQSGFGTDKSMAIADFNSDGLTDLGYYDHHSKRIKFRAFNGQEFYAQVEQIPFAYSFQEPYVQIQSGDFNGDGARDFIVCGYIEHFETALSATGSHDLLSKIDNGIGGVTTISYASSAYQPNVFLPFAIQMVQSVTTDSGQGEPYTIQYDRSHGLWNVAHREFRGFGQVQIQDADGNYTQMHYLQDDIFKGRLERTESLDAAGHLYGKTENIWAHEEVSSGVNFVFLAQKDDFRYDGNTDGVRTQEQYIYGEAPQWGNLTKTIQRGFVDLQTGQDVAEDTRTTEVSYHNSTSGSYWLLGLPKEIVIKDHAQNIMRKTAFYYDGHQDLHAMPILGQLTKKEFWGGSLPGAVHPVSQYAYDSYGNLIATQDPRGYWTEMVYDNDFYLFPLQIKNAKNHVEYKTYYGINGVPLHDDAGHRGLWGQGRSVQDPNGQKVETTYDAFGRPIATVAPLDSLVFPTTSAEYELTSFGVKVIARQRQAHGKPGTIDTVSFYDGLGRLVQTKSESGYMGQYIVSGQTEYNSRGLPCKKYHPRLTSFPLTTPDPIDESVPHALIAYDAMGRVVQTTNPDGSFSTVIYDDLVTAAIDENGHKQASVSDAYGRLVERREYLGADGRSPHYPAQGYSLYATTYYQYDSEGNLIQLQDALGNMTTLSYDALGRKLAMDDPDMGHWEYDYDPAGNLVWQKDAKNQEMTFVYDEINRLIHKSDAASINVSYTYDASSTVPIEIPGQEMPLDRGASAQGTHEKIFWPDALPTNLPSVNMNHGIGRLAKASYPLMDQTRFLYDERGREKLSIKKIDAASYAVRRQYDAANRLTSLIYPDQSTLVYTYNDAGQVDGVGERIPNSPSFVYGQKSTSMRGATQLNTNNSHKLKRKKKAFLTSNAASLIFLEDKNVLTQRYSEIKEPTDPTGPGGTISLMVDPLLPVRNIKQHYALHVSWSGAAYGNWQYKIFLGLVGGSIPGQPMPAIPPGALNWSVNPPQQWSGDYIDINTSSGSLTVMKELEPYSYYDNFIWKAWLFCIPPWPGAVYYPSSSQHLVPAAPDPGVDFEVTPENPHPAVLASYQFDVSWQDLPMGNNYDYRLFYSLVENDTGNFYSAAKDPATGDVWLGEDIDIPDNESSGVYAGSKDLIAFSHHSENPITSYQWVAQIRRVLAGQSYDPQNPETFYIVLEKTITVAPGENLQVALSINYFRPIMNAEAEYEISLSWDHAIPTFNGENYDYRYYATILDADSNYLAATTSNGQWWEEEGVIENPAPNTVTIMRKLTVQNHDGSSSNTDRFIWMGEIRRYHKNNPSVYDVLSFVSQIVDGKDLGAYTYIGHIQYNAAGQILSIEYGNATRTQYTYDPQNLRLLRLETQNAQGQPIQDLQYTYDSVGNMLSITDAVHSASQSFLYDALNRLVCAQGYYGIKMFEYNPIGNIIQKDGLTFTCGENGAGPHAVTSLSDGTTFQYDANGNRLTKTEPGGAVWSYFYDTDNRLTEVKKSNATQAKFFYDGDGGRVKRIIYRDTAAPVESAREVFDLARFSYSKNSSSSSVSNITKETTKYVGSVYEVNGSHATRYIYLGDTRVAQVQDGQVVFYHSDHLGGTNLLTDEQGVIKELCEYLPFGEFSRHEKYGNSAQVAHWYYTGKQLDENIGLYYYGARYYDPALGRFITADTVVPRPGNPQEFNRYSYCLNDPINRVDPTGHWSWKKFWKKTWNNFVHAVRHPFDFKGQWNNLWSEANDPVMAPITSAVLTIVSFAFMQPELFWTSAMWTSASASAGSTAFLQSPAGQNVTDWTARNIYDNILGMRPSTARIWATIDLSMTSSFMIERAIAGIIADPASVRNTSITDAEVKELRSGYFAGDEGTFGPSLKTKGAFTRSDTKALTKNGDLFGSYQTRTLDVPGLKQLGAQHSSANALAVSGPQLNPLRYATWGTCHQATNVTLLQGGVSSTILNLGPSWDMFVTTAVYGNYGGQLGSRIYTGINSQNN